MKLAHQLALLLCGLVALMAGSAWYTYTLLSDIHRRGEHVHDYYLPLSSGTSELVKHQAAEAAVVAEMQLLRARQVTAAADLKDLVRTKKDMDDDLDEKLTGIKVLLGEARQAGLDEEEIQDLKQLEGQLATIETALHDYDTAVTDWSKQASGSAALADATEITTKQEAAAAAINAFRTTVDSTATAVMQRAQDESRRARWQLLIAGAAVVVLALLAGGYFVARLTGPLRQVVQAAQQIAAGDLAVTLHATERSDEVGELTRSFAGMVGGLQATAQVTQAVSQGDLTVKAEPRSERDTAGRAVATMVQNLRQAINQLQETVQQLATAATQIMSTTTEFASSATETASSIAETTATVAEVRQTAELVHEKAAQMAGNAQHVETIALSGAQAVTETTACMTRIQEQMSQIADSIINLSEQSQAIGDIIDAVEDLAEQSNLLAVNAAIEAAKAGEQGKGFAVVAQEIRNLANESKRATGRVRSLLGDIQKATGTAVMVTEQGSKAVAAGVQQAEQANGAIRSLSENIRETATAASQIAASSQEQLAGMEQVSAAMTDIRHASDQNAQGSRLIESAGRNLRELGSKLQDLVARYRV
jgi:methyl-accepting chemotaxis protein